MRQFIGKRAIAAVLAVFIAACELSTGPGGSDIANVRIQPSSVSIPLDGDVQLSATVEDDAGNPVDAEVFWASEDESLAVVSEDGMVTGVALGTVRVAASAGGVSALATIDVEPKPVATVTISPADTLLLVGQEVVLTPTARDAAGGALAGRSATWSSADDAVATVDGEGRVIAVAPGNTEITASIEGKVGTASIEVSSSDVARVEITPSAAALKIGETLQFTARARDTEGEELTGRTASWVSSAPEIVEISSTGLATALAIGAATITATIDGASASVGVGVGLQPVATVTVSPSEVQLEVGESTGLDAVLKAADGSVLSERDVGWSSADEGIATVGRSGEVTAVAPGTVTITATSEGKTGSAQVTVVPQPVATVEVLPASFTLVVGGTAELQALTKAADGATLSDRSVTWASDDEEVASVSENGVVTAKGVGSAKITATSEGESGSATVIVQTEPVASVEIEPETATVFVGAARQLKATARSDEGDELEGRPVAWSSDDERVAVVDRNGRVAGVSPGGATITATSEGRSATAEITVVLRPVETVELNRTTATLPVGGTVELEATLKAGDGSVLTGRRVEWSSNRILVASVNDDGLVRGFLPGTATITARSEGKSASAVITVKLKSVQTVELNPSAATLTVGDTRQLTATLKAGDGEVLTDRAIKWSSDDEEVATVSDEGLVTAHEPGVTTITARSEGEEDESVITVQAKKVSSVVLDPPAIVLRVGDTKQFTVTARASDGTELTGRTVAWSSTAPDTVEISDSGLATARLEGAATIQAEVDGVVGSAGVAVQRALIATVEVKPSTNTLDVGDNVSLEAIMRAANGQVLTGRPVAWESSDDAVATVAGSGVVTAHGAGSATITATSEGKSGTATVTVEPVATVTISPGEASIIVGETEQLTTTLKAEDGSTLSGREVSWSSSDEDVATVDDDGLVTAVSPGAVTITASSEDQDGTAEITVNPVPVETVEVTPSSAELVVGDTQELTAITRATNGSELTGRVVTWTSDNDAVASVTNDGVVTAVGAGEAVIYATSEGRRGTAAITVLEAVSLVTVTPSADTLFVGDIEPLAAVTKSEDGTVLTGRSISWTSSNEGVATVDANGVVTAIGAGGATITARSEGAPGTSEITVLLPPAAVLIVSGDDQEARNGELLAEPLVVRVVDAEENPVPGVLVSWRTLDGSISASGEPTGSDGIASASWTLGEGATEVPLAWAEVGELAAEFSAMRAYDDDDD